MLSPAVINSARTEAAHDANPGTWYRPMTTRYDLGLPAPAPRGEMMTFEGLEAPVHGALPSSVATTVLAPVGNIATVSHSWHNARMANVEKLSVALTPDMVAEVRAAVTGGDYGSVSEVVRDALRDWRLRRKIETLETEELRRLVQEGIDSGPGLDADAVFARLRSHFGQQPTK